MQIQCTGSNIREAKLKYLVVTAVCTESATPHQATFTDSASHVSQQDITLSEGLGKNGCKKGLQSFAFGMYFALQDRGERTLASFMRKFCDIAVFYITVLSRLTWTQFVCFSDQSIDCSRCN